MARVMFLPWLEYFYEIDPGIAPISMKNVDFYAMVREPTSLYRGQGKYGQETSDQAKYWCLCILRFFCCWFVA